MTPASVGFQCPECVHAGNRSVRSPRTHFGGSLSRRPELTSYVLIGINVIVFGALLLAGGSSSALGRALLLTPRAACSTGDGSVYVNVTNSSDCSIVGGIWERGVADGAIWQLLTSGFSHVALLHIGFNMLALFVLGPQVERVLGRTRFLALYFLSLLAGSAAVMWWSEPYSSTLGASGAIFGLMGALLVIVIRVGGNPQQILMWLGLNVAITVLASGGISWQGHLGGLLGGVAVAGVLAYAPKNARTPVQVVGLCAIGVVIAVLVAVRVLVLN